MRVGQSLTWLLDGISVVLGLTLRYSVLSFVRWKPWGYRVFDNILLIWSLCLIAWLIQLFAHWRFYPQLQLRISPSKAKSKGLLWSLVSGRFDPHSPLAALASLVSNSLLTLVAIDFVYRARIFHRSSDLAFSRMGYIDGSSAKVVVRFPVETPIKLQYYVEGADFKSTEQPNQLRNENVRTPKFEEDYVVTFELDGLQPDTVYKYWTNASHEGTFSTLSTDPKRWSFVSSSCIKPFFPYNPFDHSLSMKGFSHLSRHLRNTKTDMVFFLGDFIYIDLPKRFGYGTEDYQEAYRQIYASPDWSEELRSISWIHVYDDHEITNNWSSNETGIYSQAISPFMAYQHKGNPKPVRSDATYYTFTRGDVSFFVMDTRRYRSPGALPDVKGKTMLGSQQLQDFKSWLKENPRTWKVVISSVPFTKNFHAPDFEDSWAGYLCERQELLSLMWETDGVLIITGDRHEHATTVFPHPVTNSSSTVVEFSTSPLNQFIEPFVRTYRQEDDTDVAVHYHYAGTSKFGTFTFDTSNDKLWKMDFELVVNGKVTWNYTVHQPK